MEFVTIDDVRQHMGPAAAGIRVAFNDKNGSLRIGTLRIKKVRCGKKNCTKCPHSSYMYVQYREGTKVKSKYVGVSR